MLIDKLLIGSFANGYHSMIDKIWNLTNEVHLTLTEWKPIPLIYPIRHQ
jgi:hypothetical protein